MHWKRLREAYKEFAVGFDANEMVTLATNQDGNIEKMRKLVDAFAVRMDRWALGRFYHTLPISKRANGIFFVEHVSSNIHAHGLVHFPYGSGLSRLLKASEFWRSLCPSGSIDVQLVQSVEGIANYVTKEMKWDRYDSDQVILLADRMSDKSLYPTTD
jgi:hypothetical protein